MIVLNYVSYELKVILDTMPGCHNSLNILGKNVHLSDEADPRALPVHLLDLPL